MESEMREKWEMGIAATAGDSLHDTTCQAQLIANARKGCASVSEFDDQRLDLVIAAVSMAVVDRLAWFAQEEAEQSGMGSAPHKQHKLSMVTGQVTQSLLGIKTRGMIAARDQGTLLEYASPLGIIFAVVPLTNPVPNSLFKVLHSIKTRNAIIFSYPSKTRDLGQALVDMVRDVLVRHGIDPGLVQTVPADADREFVRHMMSHPGVDLILATGGSAIVQAAYRSGNPTYGVGPGNAPAIVCASADVSRAAHDIVQSKTYDHGIVCGSENSVIVDPAVYDAFVTQLRRHGTAVLTPAELARTLDQLFSPAGKLHKTWLGKPADVIARQCGIERDYPIQLVALPCAPDQIAVLGREKMAPLIALIQAPFGRALALADAVLRQEGLGHTAAIHSNDPDQIHQFAQTICAARLLINTPATFGMMGVSTDLPLSFALGSGSWGKNITTAAINWRHFLNIKLLAKHTSTVDLSRF